jgi:hypothetical protein
LLDRFGDQAARLLALTLADDFLSTLLLEIG